MMVNSFNFGQYLFSTHYIQLLTSTKFSHSANRLHELILSHIRRKRQYSLHIAFHFNVSPPCPSFIKNNKSLLLRYTCTPIDHRKCNYIINLPFAILITESYSPKFLFIQFSPNLHNYLLLQ